MKRLSFCFTILASTAVLAETPEAIDTLVEAVSQTKTVQSRIKKIERKIVSQIEDALPFDKKYLLPFVGTAAILSEGRVDTRQFKALEFKVLNGRLRTDLSHDFIQQQTEATINTEWEF